MTPAERAPHDCKPDDWLEEYYGWRCRVCDAFIPFGSEPWLPLNEAS